MTNLKESIVSLRLQGLTYNTICERLKCAKSTVAFHCSQLADNEKTKASNLKKRAYCLRSLENWDEKTQSLVALLHSVNVRKSEIADVLNLNLRSVRIFCESLPRPPSQKNLPNYEKVKRRRKRLKLLAVLYKGGKCQQCGYCSCIESLEFHHLDNTQKEFGIAKLCNCSWQKIKAEIAKCELLCANCHREEHANNKESAWVDLNHQLSSIIGAALSR